MIGNKRWTWIARNDKPMAGSNGSIHFRISLELVTHSYTPAHIYIHTYIYIYTYAHILKLYWLPIVQILYILIWYGCAPTLSLENFWGFLGENDEEPVDSPHGMMNSYGNHLVSEVNHQTKWAMASSSRSVRIVRLLGLNGWYPRLKNPQIHHIY